VRQILSLLRRFPPTLVHWRRLGQALWLALRGGWRALVWGDLTSGMVNLRGAPASVRMLVWTALLLLLALLLSLLFNDVWRAAFALRPVSFLTVTSAPALAPRPLIPITLGLLALAWAYILSGALAAGRWLKLFVLVVFAVDFFFSLTYGGGSGWSALLLSLQLAGAAGIALIFWRMRGPQRRPGVAFALLLTCTTAMWMAGYMRAWLLEQELNASEAWTASLVGAEVQFMAVFLFPFVVMAGAEIAELAVEMTGVVGGAIRGFRPPARWLALALAAGLGYRAWGLWLAPLIAGEPWNGRPAAWIALALMAAVVGLARARGSERELPAWAMVAPAAALGATLFAATLVVLVVGGGAIALLVVGGEGTTLYQQGMAAVERGLQSLLKMDQLAVAGLVAGWGAWMARKARQQGRNLPAVAVFAWVFAIWSAWKWALASRPEWAVWQFDYTDMDAVLSLAALMLLAGLWATRRLTESRLEWLLAAALLAWFLGLQDFLSDPLSPLFGLLGAQALFLSVGVFMNVMSAGQRFLLNENLADPRRFHRILLYFGYALLSVTITHWQWAAHQRAQIHLIDLQARNGFLLVGLPLAFYALFARTNDIMGET